MLRVFSSLTQQVSHEISANALL